MSGSADAAGSRAAGIHAVAELAGVAVSTVSRALSNPGLVNVHTREKVERAAAELNYVPNSRARALTPGRTGYVAMVMPDIANPFYFDILRGAHSQLKAAGYVQVLVDTEESPDEEMASLERLRKSVDGVILSASRLTDEQLAAAAESMPLVAINRDIPGVSSVIIDTPTGITQCVDHLVSLGHRKIAYIAGPSSSWSSGRRWQSLQAHAKALNIEAVQIGEFSPRTTSGAAAAEAAINSRVSACIVFDDLMAIGMLQRLAARGVRVPEQMSIVGCDDVFGADICSPPLTTLTAPVEQAGKVATTILLAQLGTRTGAGQPRKMTLPTYLTIRSSTGPAPDSRLPDGAVTGVPDHR